MNNQNAKTVAIIGATGLIGRILCEYFLEKKYNIICYCRNKSDFIEKNPNKFIIKTLNIESFNEENIDKEIDLLINAAYIKSQDNEDSSSLNIESATKLADICHKNNTKYVFLSSFSASENAISNYGKTKFIIENKLDFKTDLILRLGLVIGKAGLFKDITSIINKSSLIPLIGGGNQHTHTVSVYEIGPIIEFLFLNNKSGLYIIGDKEGCKMKDIYIEIAKYENKKPIFINIPYFFADIAFYIIEKLNIKIGVNRDNYLGLKNLKKTKNINTKAEVGIDVSDYKKSIKRLY